MTFRPLWLAVASIVAVAALSLFLVWAMCRAAARADRAAERGARQPARCPGCRHDHIGAAYCGAPLADVVPDTPALCGCVNGWHLAPTGEPVVHPTKEELDRLWEKVAEAMREERDK